MKIHNIINRASVILETEDDLFPGLDSSAFDELTPRDQRPDPRDDLDSLMKHQLEIADRGDVHLDQYNLLMQYLEDNNALNPIIRSLKKNGDEPYYNFDWLSKYNRIERKLEAYTINKSSPLFNTIESKIRSLNNIQLRMDDFDKKLLTIAKEIEHLQDGQ